MRKELKDQVLAAKGDDRSYRQYAEDCGVDAATIAKIAKGHYVPKNPQIFYRLTSVQAKPRNNVTAEDLIDAAKYSREFRAGMRLGAMGVSMLNPVGMMAMTAANMLKATEEIKRDEIQDKKVLKRFEKLDEYRKKVQQYIAISNGLIYDNIYQKGIAIKPVDTNKDNILEREIALNTGAFKQYILKYIFIEDDKCEEDAILLNIAQKSLDGLILMEPLKSRKITYVVNSEKLYIQMCEFKDKLSYLGNISVIYIDQMNTELKGEECICRFDDISDKTVINMI